MAEARHAERAARSDARAWVPSARASARLGAYIRRLREGYGYTLRKVEERSAELGEPIDNSQLSRFEKGKAVPSFDKLRALARVFNVSVQNFADVLDLEQFTPFKPRESSFEALLNLGAAQFARGEPGRAFVAFERALEVAETEPSAASPETLERILEARWRMAASLRALGKLALAEHELRELLRGRAHLPPRIHIRTLLQLTFVYRELGDAYLASLMARECLDLAAAHGDLKTQASVLNTLANLHFDSGEFEDALAYYDRAREVLDALGGHDEMKTTLLVNLGGCLATLGRFDEGAGVIEQALARARRAGYRRAAALALTRLAEAHVGRGDHDRARKLLGESDALAGGPPESYPDILFLNAYRLWEMARAEGLATREKLAFGRLRHLRSMLERRFPEVDAFDRYVEQARRRQP